VIQLNSSEPIKGKAYSLPHALREILDKEIDNMLAMKIIEESTAAYASPEPMPTAEEIFAKLSGDRFFSKFDLSKGYWQVPVREQDIETSPPLSATEDCSDSE